MAVILSGRFSTKYFPDKIFGAAKYESALTRIFKMANPI